MDRSKDSLEFKFFGLTRAMNRVLSTDFGYPYDCWKKPEEETVARIPFAAWLLINLSILSRHTVPWLQRAYHQAHVEDVDPTASVISHKSYNDSLDSESQCFFS